MAGYGEPTVAHENATMGASTTAGTSTNAAIRPIPSGRARTSSGSSSAASGRARTASEASATVHASRSRARASSAPATSSAASVTSMPESPPHAIGPVHSKATAATVATAGDAPHASAARRVTIAAPTAQATPITLTIATEAPATKAPAASSSVHSGAVEPATGRPGLYDEPKTSGDVPREVQMNPRIIERKPRHPRDQPLPNDEQDERQRRGDEQLEVGSHSSARTGSAEPAGGSKRSRC